MAVGKTGVCRPCPQCHSPARISCRLAHPWVGCNLVITNPHNADRSRAYIVMLVHFDGKPLGFMTASLEASAYVYDTLGDMVGMAVDRIGRVAPDQVGLKVAAGR